jgi:chemotaxis response regulator CheB
VVIVNDSAVARAVIAAVLQADGGFRLLGQATCGQDGVDLVRRLRPELVLLDMHMPDINGVETTRRIMAERPTRILITSATIRRNTAYLFDALEAGALDYTHTPSLTARPGASVDRAALLAAGEGLLRKMRTVLRLAAGAAARAKAASGTPGTAQASPTPPARAAATAAVASPGLRLVAVGSSTGGPTALATLFRNLPRGLDAAFLISQHIDPEFSEGLARWLGQESGHPCAVARQGEAVRPGQVYLASGGRRNLVIGTGGRLAYESAGEAIYAPNINRMFASVAAHAGARACGVVLTGLGDDGAEGLAMIQSAGGAVLVQDPATAVVDGMPGAPIRRGILTRGHALPELARYIARWVEGRP